MKYKLLKNDTKMFLGSNLYRIKYLKDINHTKKGDLGGYIEKESNFSQDDDSLVLDNALVSGDARVHGNALVYGQAWVHGNSLVYGEARVHGNAQVCGEARVHGNALVYGGARLSGNAQVCGDAQVHGNAHLYSNVKVEKSPIIILNFKHTICITETHIFIGCEGHTIEHWKKNIIKIGLKNNYTKNEIKKVIKILKCFL